MKFFFRNLQTFFPGLKDLKFRVQRLIRRGKLSEPDLEILNWLDTSGPFTYLDVGANRGDTILDVAKLVPNAKIIGFEPNPDICNGARRLAKNLPEVNILNIGLGEKAEDLTLFIPVYRGYSFDGLASIHRKNAENWLKTRLFLYRDKLLTIKKIKCTIQPLDQFLLTPSFIKMDVQGHELAVLKGGKQMIQKHRPTLLLESATPEIQELLQQWGYHPYHIRKDKLEAGAGQLNTIFLTPNSIDQLTAIGKIAHLDTSLDLIQRRS